MTELKIILRILVNTHFNIMKQQNQYIPKNKKQYKEWIKQQQLRQHKQ